MNKFYITCLIILVAASILHQEQILNNKRKIAFLECETKRMNVNVDSVVEYTSYVPKISREHTHIYHNGKAKYDNPITPYVPQDNILNYDCVWLTSPRPMVSRYNASNGTMRGVDIKEKDIPVNLYRQDERK